MTMKTLIQFFTILIMFTSCNQDRINLLEKQLEEKNNEIEKLKDELGKIEKNTRKNEKAKPQNEIESSNRNLEIRAFSDQEIISIVKYEMNFKCPETQIKDYVVRKTNDDKYEVRFYQKLKEFDKYYWDKIIVHIKIFPGDKYTFNIWDGVHCSE
jgi:hypothetical protein